MQFSKPDSAPVPVAESPHYVRVSLAAAMTLGFVPGWFTEMRGLAVSTCCSRTQGDARPAVLSAVWRPRRKQ